MKVLVIDDDIEISSLISTLLKQNNITPYTVSNLADAREIMQQQAFSVLVLDVLMENENGIEFTEELRRKKDSTPIIIVSALNSSQDRVAGLIAGANDYLPKPFDAQELLIRIKNISHFSADKTISVGPITLDNINKTIAHNKKQIKINLTDQNATLLNLLMTKHEGVISKDEIIRAFNQQPTLSNIYKINTAVMRLRQTLDPLSENISISTVRNQGYMLSIHE